MKIHNLTTKLLVISAIFSLMMPIPMIAQDEKKPEEKKADEKKPEPLPLKAAETIEGKLERVEAVRGEVASGERRQSRRRRGARNLP